MVTMINTTNMQIRGPLDPVDELLYMTADDVAPAPIMSVVVLSVVSLFGIAMNSLVISTYRRNVFKKSTYMLTLCLAVSDLTSCGILIMELIDILHAYTQTEVLCKLVPFLRYYGELVSGFIVVCISIDRYLNVSRPRDTISNASVVGAVISVLVFSLLCCSYSILIYDMSEHTRDSANVTTVVKVCGYSELATDTNMHVMFFILLVTILTIGAAIICVFHFRLVRVLCKNTVTTTRVFTSNIGIYDRQQPNSSRQQKYAIPTVTAADGSASSHMESDRYSNVSELQRNSADPHGETGHSKVPANGDRVSRLLELDAALNSLYSIMSETSNDRTRIPYKETTDESERMYTYIPTKDARNITNEKAGVKYDSVINYSNHVTSCTSATVGESLKTTRLPIDINGSNKPIRPAGKHHSVRHKTLRRSSTSLSRNQPINITKISLLLMAASVVYVLCHIPHICWTLLELFNVVSLYALTPNAKWVIDHSYMFSFVLDPLLYAFMNRRFRADCRRLWVSALCCSKRTRRSNTKSMHPTVSYS